MQNSVALHWEIIADLRIAEDLRRLGSRHSCVWVMSHIYRALSHTYNSKAQCIARPLPISRSPKFVRMTLNLYVRPSRHSSYMWHDSTHLSNHIICTRDPQHMSNISSWSVMITRRMLIWYDTFVDMTHMFDVTHMFIGHICYTYVDMTHMFDVAHMFIRHMCWYDTYI